MIFIEGAIRTKLFYSVNLSLIPGIPFFLGTWYKHISFLKDHWIWRRQRPNLLLSSVVFAVEGSYQELGVSDCWKSCVATAALSDRA
jgi:hypothetical protein